MDVLPILLYLVLLMVGIAAIVVTVLWVYTVESRKSVQNLSNRDRQALDAFRSELGALRGRVENIETLLVEQERARPWRELEAEADTRDTERV